MKTCQGQSLPNCSIPSIFVIIGNVVVTTSLCYKVFKMPKHKEMKNEES